MSNTDKKTLAQEFVRRSRDTLQGTREIKGYGWKGQVRQILEPLRAEGESFDDVDDDNLIKARTSVLRALAVCYHGRTEADKVESALDECLNLDPSDPQNWIALGRYYRFMGRDREALGCFARIVSGVGKYPPLDPHNKAVWPEIVKTYEKIGDVDAVRLCHEIMQGSKGSEKPVDRQSVKALMLQSYMYRDQGLPDKQIECLERIVYGTLDFPPIDGRDIRARIALASMYWKTNQHLKALACAEPIVKGDDAINPQDAGAWLFLSELNRVLKNDAESALCRANAVKYGHVSTDPRREPR